MEKIRKKRLNIAVMGSATLPIPPFEGYGGTQRGVYDFINNMNKKGHKIHLFGPGDSNISHLENVILHSVVDKSLWIPENNLPLDEKLSQEKAHYDFSLKRLGEIEEEEVIDIVNLRKDNTNFIEDVVKIIGPERIVYSLHNLKSQSRIDAINDMGLVSIAHCRNHKEEHDNLPNINVIMYGVSVDSYSFSDKKLSEFSGDPGLEILRNLKERGEDYLITLGGIGKHKGQRTSIELANSSGIPLVIAGEPQDRRGNKNGIYFDEEVKPFIDGENVIYFGNANEEQKKILLRYAKGFLFPSGYEDKNWSEPFGRAPVEALACGTPVIAYRKGSMPEIIFDSFNGFLFESSSEGIDSIGKLERISRSDCRRTAEVKFDSKRVSDEYEELFYAMIDKNEKNGF